MGFRLTGIVIAVALLLPAGVLAQPKSPGAAVQTKEKAEAKVHYDQGTVHFNLDEWPQAIQEFKAAYRLVPDAIFLYNIAQCHRKMGDGAEALSFYKKYLRERPDAPNRSEVEKRIDELEAAQAAQSKSREAPPAGLAPPNLPAPPPTAAAPSEPPPAIAPSGPPAGPAPTEPAAAPLAQPPPALGNAAPPVPARTEPAWPGADVTTTAPAASSSILRKWWFWTGVGVVVAAAVVVTAVELSHSSSPSHYQGDMDPPVLTVP